MKKIAKFLPLGLLVLGSSAFAATSNIKMPTPDYTDFYAAVGTVLGISVVVLLAKYGKSFFLGR